MIVAGNWKMFKTSKELKEFFRLSKEFKVPTNVRCIVAPSPTLLTLANQLSEGTSIEVFAQNCHWEEQGAFTGETSAAQILDCGSKGTLIGHSERRQYFAESNETCFKRLQAARKADLEVIFCVGEQLKDREQGKTEAVLEEQLKDIVKEFRSDSKVTLAYEPVWAIGTGVTATVEQVRDTHNWIRSYLEKNDCAWKILYGGSVKPNNFKELASLPEVFGGLVGGASLEAASFQALLDCLTDL
ncbi:triose-phosphate isomerase [bacterium]|nr:triose-phosphate isomerase [bacterium]